MGLAVYKSEINTQITSMNNNLDVCSNEINDLIKQLNFFVSDTELKGNAWESCKNYFSDAHITLLNGFQIAINTVKCANNELNDRINEDLNEDEINTQIEELRKEIIKSQDKINYYHEKKQWYSFLMWSDYDFIISVYETQIEQYEDAIEKLNEKILELKEINECGNVVFENAESILAVLINGIDSLKNSWSGSNFDISKINTSWISEIQSSYINLICYTNSKGEIEYNWNKITELLSKSEEELSIFELEALVSVVISLDNSEDINQFIMCGYVKKQYDCYYVTSDVYNCVLIAAKYKLISQSIIDCTLEENEYISQMMKLSIIENKSDLSYVPDLYNKNSIFYPITFDSQFIRSSADILNSKYPDNWVQQDAHTRLFNYYFEWQSEVKYIGCGPVANLNSDIIKNYDSSTISEKAKQLLANFAMNVGLTFVDGHLWGGAVSTVFGLSDSSSYVVQNDDFINDLELNVIELEKIKNGYTSRKDFFGRSNTEITYQVFPSKETIVKIKEENSKIDQIKCEYIKGKKNIPIKGDMLNVLKEISTDNEYFELSTSADGCVYLENIEYIDISKIVSTPNKANELYYLIECLTQ